jgi:hydrogenase maturation protease
MVLVIGYGNDLRGDDGIGRRVAEAIAEAGLPGVRVRTTHQLTPELAAEIAEASRVIFVDALADSTIESVQVQQLAIEETPDWSTHTADPRVLLALTRALYGATPDAWWVMVPGRDFGFEEGLSPFANENVRRAIDRVIALARKNLTAECAESAERKRT